MMVEKKLEEMGVMNYIEQQKKLEEQRVIEELERKLELEKKLEEKREKIKREHTEFNEMCIEYSKLIRKGYSKLDYDFYGLKQDISCTRDDDNLTLREFEKIDDFYQECRGYMGHLSEYHENFETLSERYEHSLKLKET